MSNIVQVQVLSWAPLLLKKTAHFQKKSTAQTFFDNKKLELKNLGRSAFFLTNEERNEFLTAKEG